MPCPTLKSKSRPKQAGTLLADSAYSLSVKAEEIHFSEMSLNFYQTTQYLAP
jgi:hypothetical protein